MRGRGSGGRPGPGRPGARGDPAAGAGSLAARGARGRRGGRAALTRCCCRLLTATAAADAALCRSSAACPGRRRLRVNLRVRSPAIARRGPGVRVPPAWPAPTSSTRRGSGSGTRRLSPPLPRSTRKRRVFLSSTPTLPPPALRRSFATTFQTLRSSGRARPTRRAAPARRRRLWSGGPRDARGAAPARAAPGLGWPPGAVPAAPGLRAGPARRPRPHVEAPRRAGALAAFAGLAQTFPGLARGRGPSPFALPAVETGQRLRKGLMTGISAASTPSGFPNLLCLKFLLGPWNKLPNSFKPQPVFRNNLLRAGSPCSGNWTKKGAYQPHLKAVAVVGFLNWGWEAANNQINKDYESVNKGVSDNTS